MQEKKRKIKKKIVIFKYIFWIFKQKLQKLWKGVNYLKLH